MTFEEKEMDTRQPELTVTINAKSGNVGQASIYVLDRRASAAISWQTPPSEDDIKEGVDFVGEYLPLNHGFQSEPVMRMQGPAADKLALLQEMEQFLTAPHSPTAAITPTTPTLIPASITLRTEEEVRRAIATVTFAVEEALRSGDTAHAMELSGTVGVLRWFIGANDGGFDMFLKVLAQIREAREQVEQLKRQAQEKAQASVKVN